MLIHIAVAATAGFLALTIWNTMWVFWLFGIGYICTGIAAASDNRVRDRRFKTGFKGNEVDTSDLAAGAKLIAIGLAVWVLAYFGRALFQWFTQTWGATSSWFESYGWAICFAVLGGAVTIAALKRMLLTSKNAIQAAPAPKMEYPPSEKPILSPVRDESKIHQDILRVLLYVGKADGQLRAQERSVINATLLKLGSYSIRGEGAIDELLARTEVPTLQAFKLAVGRISQSNSSVVDVVLGAATQIVATQKTIHTAEDEAIKYLQKRLSRTQ